MDNEGDVNYFNALCNKRKSCNASQKTVYTTFIFVLWLYKHYHIQYIDSLTTDNENIVAYLALQFIACGRWTGWQRIMSLKFKILMTLRSLHDRSGAINISNK